MIQGTSDSVEDAFRVEAKLFVWAKEEDVVVDVSGQDISRPSVSTSFLLVHQYKKEKSD